MNNTITAPRVWVGCLGCYNAGDLVGEWFDAGDAPTEMPEFDRAVFAGLSRIRGEHVAGGHEELWVMDSEGIPESGEFSPSRAVLWGELFERVGETQWPALIAWAAYGSHTVDSDDLPDVSSFEDAYAGEWDSEKDFAESEDGGAAGLFEGLPDDHPAVTYFDWAKWTRDVFMGDFYSTPAPRWGVFVFRSL